MRTRRVLVLVILGVPCTRGVLNWLTRFLAIGAMTATLALPAAAQTTSFQSLGQMPGVWPAAGTYASALSADGSTIMGYGWVCADGGTTCTSSGFLGITF